MKQSKISLSICLLFFAMLSACGTADFDASNSEPDNFEMSASEEFAKETSQTSTLEYRTPPDSTDATTRMVTMLIRTADIRMKVEDHDVTAKAIRKLISFHEGFVSGERANGDENYQETSLDIRVPNTRFDSLVERIASLAGKLDHKNITSQDVGEEYVDLKSRLEARKVAEQTYMEILKSARKISEVLEVQDKLRQVREEIESAQGRMRFLQNRVSLSTITVTFYTSHQVAAAVSSGAGLGERISVAFFIGWNSILSGLVGLTYLWPIWILVAVFILMRKRIFRRGQTTKAVNK
jgi:hypothetical protein